MAIEIAPDLGWTKGTALRMIVEHVAGAAVLPLYAGDDANDAEALLAAADLGGIAIGIGPRAPSLARYRLPNAQSLECVLEVLLDMLVDSGPANCRRRIVNRPCRPPGATLTTPVDEAEQVQGPLWLNS